MTVFAGTSVDVVLLGPANGTSGFSAILRDAATARPASRMASVNAGDPGLYVTGGTINLAFSQQIPQAPAYQRLHSDALMAARSGTGVITGFAAGAPVRLIHVARGDGDATSGPPAAGTVFLDVFADGGQPYAVAENHAMAYVVPPYGPSYPDAASFLAAVGTAMARVVTVIAAFNAAIAAGDKDHAGIDPITDLRTCLVSGGQFRRKDTTPDDVAKAIYAGLARGLAAGPSGLQRVELESGTGEFAGVSAATGP